MSSIEPKPYSSFDPNRGTRFGKRLLHPEIMEIIKKIDKPKMLADITITITTVVEKPDELPAAKKVKCYEHLQKMMESKYIDDILESLKYDHTIIPGVIQQLKTLNPLRTKTVGIRQFCRIPPYRILNSDLRGLKLLMMILHHN